ncbi:MAG: hypothetical protein GWO08_14895, partial [Gammaproteobacteria bacterium]|nr:hypothetical protein [Gammaproteobacteria bacterium]NIQ76025.1 hypothetical protein [Gammaproteobacteria bacterium]NIR94897.1 hypothetical protein [Gammaproteobacteria bacterium]
MPVFAEGALADLVSEWQRLNDKYQMKDEDVVRFERLAEVFHNLFMPPSEDKKEEKKNLFARLL